MLSVSQKLRFQIQVNGKNCANYWLNVGRFSKVFFKQNISTLDFVHSISSFMKSSTKNLLIIIKYAFTYC